MSCEECLYGKRIELLELAIDRNGIDHAEFRKQINEIDKGQAVSNTNYNTIITTLQEIKKDIEALKGKPSQRWEDLIKTAITVIITGTITFAMSKIF